MDVTRTEVHEEGMKNDLIVAILGFVLSAIVAWVSSLTVMVFELEKNHAVQAVRQELNEKELKQHKHDRMKAL